MNQRVQSVVQAPPAPASPPDRGLLAAAAASGASLLLWELLLSRVFAVVLFADLAHLALGAAMLGLTVGALATAWSAPAETGALRRRVAWLLLAQGAAAVLTVVLALHLPLLETGGPGTFYTRDPQRFELLNPIAFGALILTLPLPAAFGGALVAAVLRHPGHEAPGYAADLGASGLMAALFVPLCGWWAAPDLALVAAAVACAGALPLWPRAAGAPLLAALVVSVIALQAPVLSVDRAAGWSERDVFAERWTGTARYSLARTAGGGVADGDWLLVDNGSASGVVTEGWQVDQLQGFPSRGLVHALHGPGRVLVPAAGAGPEVAVALAQEHTDVVAVELDPGMFELLDEHYGDAHPYADPRVTAVALDGRAAALRDPAPFDIVHLVWANFFGAAGRIQAAWTPQLLYTQEAIDTWLDTLHPGGTLSMAGPSIGLLEATATAALRDRGVARPDRHLLTVRGADGVVLVKPRPFTAAERKTAQRWLRDRTRPVRRGPAPKVALTDDKPYPDRLRDLFQSDRSGAIPIVYRAMVWGLGLSLAGLGLVVAGAFVGRTPKRVGSELGLAACLGYGYLALQVVLLHQVVLYVGHPTVAFATVLGAMLLGSGAGGLWVTRTPVALLGRRLRLGLLGVVVCGLAIVALARVGGPLLLLAPAPVRIGVVAALVGTLGVFAGLPMPAALRLRGGRHPQLTPLLWATNGWASVLAATAAVLLARLTGYTAALGIALAAYLLALVVTRTWGRD